MDVKLTTEALKDRKDFSDSQWSEIESKIGELGSKLSHDDLKLVDNPFLENPVWQLTVDGSEVDHRVFVDLNESSIVVVAIWDFEFTHQGDRHWRELPERL